MLKTLGTATAALAVCGFTGCSDVMVKLRKLKGKIISNPPYPDPADLAPYTLAPGWESVSVETALNSRCSSDNDGAPGVFHWGMFSRKHGLSLEQIQEVVAAASPCVVRKGRASITAADDFLFFTIDDRLSGKERRWAMIESGMQIQAAALQNAARGIAWRFHNMGRDGSATEHGFSTIRMRLGAMKPSYRGAFWTEDAPDRERPWQSGNLPDPFRRSSVPLADVMQSFSIQGGSEVADRKAVGQILWAARGRTPHMFFSAPWAMTVPCWKGGQDHASVSVLSPKGAFRYVNFNGKRPTHQLAPLTVTAAADTLSKNVCDGGVAIVINQHEPSAASTWEAGCMVLNAAIQAAALGVAFEVKLLDDVQMQKFEQAGMRGALAAVCLPKASLA